MLPFTSTCYHSQAHATMHKHMLPCTSTCRDQSASIPASHKGWVPASLEAPAGLLASASVAAVPLWLMPVAKKLEAFVWALGLTQCTCGCAVSHSTTAYEKHNIRHQQLLACNHAQPFYDKPMESRASGISSCMRVTKHSHSMTAYGKQNIRHQQLLARNQAQPFYDILWK